MENKTQTVLSAFTRKLANCRHTVSLKALMKYFDEGKFGYTYDEDDVEVVTNDFVFADDIATLVSHLRNIFKKPRMFLKKEYVVQNASVATNVDTESTRETYRDDKLWKVKDGEIQPEYVHSFVNEDNYAVYENRFVCALIDKVFEIVGKKISSLSADLDTVADKFNGSTPVDFAESVAEEDGIPCLIPTKDPLVATMESLIKSKKQLLVFKGRQLYADCKKAGGFNLFSVKPTNVLTFDADYNFCYNFFVNYLFRDPNLANRQQRYYNFIVINFLKALETLGYEVQNENPLVAVTNSIKLRFDPITYKKDPFTLTVTLGEDDQILVDVAAYEQEVSARYAFKVVSDDKAEDSQEFMTTDAYARRIVEVRDEGVMQSFLVTDAGKTDEGNAVFVSAEATDSQAKIKRLVRLCTMAVEGAQEIHSRYCPVCNSTLVTFDGDDYYCRGCDTIYRIFPYDEKEIVWMKRIRPEKQRAQEPPKVDKEFKKDRSIRIKLQARRR